MYLMGNTTKSRLHFEGRTYDGEALLETSELVFRGERRLLIPFAKITAVDVGDAMLHVTFDGGIAIFEVGPQAAQWAEKIRNPKSVVQKIGIKAGHVVSVLHVDDEAFLADLEKAGAAISRGRVRKNSDAIVFGASKRADLDRMATLKDSLRSNGALWVIRPDAPSARRRRTGRSASPRPCPGGRRRRARAGRRSSAPCSRDARRERAQADRRQQPIAHDLITGSQRARRAPGCGSEIANTWFGRHADRRRARRRRRRRGSRPRRTRSAR
jgi:hypothetical protein